jgi:type I restriction enzyme S subunit
MNGWEEVQLKDVVSILGDGLHGTPEYSDDGEYYFVNGNNLSDGSIVITQETKRVSHSEYLKYKKELGDRTLFVSINGTIGNIAYYKGEKIVLGKSACYFNLLESVDKDFIRYTLSTEYFQKYAHTYANGTTIKNLGLKAMREFSFSLPPLQEQQQIAATLSCLDRKIENLRRQNETLEAIAQTLFKHWFIDFEFPNADGKPYKSSGGAMEPSEIGDIPSGWRVGNLRDITKVINGRAYKQTEFKEEGTPIVRIQNLTGKGQTVYSDLTLDKHKYISKGDLIYAWSATFGPYIWRGVKSIYHYHIWKLNCFNPAFKYYLYIHLKNVSDRVKGQGTGSIFTHITKELMESQELFIPGDKVMEKWHNLANSAFEKIMLNYEQIETLIQTREVLLPKLMSGKLRITS